MGGRKTKDAILQVFLLFKELIFDTQGSVLTYAEYSPFPFTITKKNLQFRVRLYIIRFLLDHSTCQAVHSALYLHLNPCSAFWWGASFPTTQSVTSPTAFAVDLRSDFLAVMEKHTNCTQENILQVPKTCRDIEVWFLWWPVLKTTVEKG